MDMSTSLADRSGYRIAKPMPDPVRVRAEEVAVWVAVYAALSDSDECDAEAIRRRSMWAVQAFRMDMGQDL